MVSCSRIGLQYAAQQYLAGQAKGDYSALPLATGLGYWEQFKPVDIKTGFLTKKLNINRSFALFDEETCQTYVEIMVTDKAEPYVAGIRMRVSYDKIAEIDIIYETTGYWLLQRRRLPQVRVAGRLGPGRASQAFHARSSWSVPPTPIWMHFSKQGSKRCPGAIPACASRVARTPAAVMARRHDPMLPARPECLRA